MRPHETHLLTHFWLLLQHGRQVNAWIVYCACHARQRHAEHAIQSAMISQMCSCSFMAMTFVVLVWWLSADSTQILNDLLLQCACVNRVAVCAFALSAMDASIWYQFCGHCAMFAFLDGVCQGIVIWHALHSTFAAVSTPTLTWHNCRANGHITCHCLSFDMHDAPTWDTPAHTLLTPPSKWPTGKCMNCVLCMPCTAATCGACHTVHHDQLNVFV